MVPMTACSNSIVQIFPVRNTYDAKESSCYLLCGVQGLCKHKASPAAKSSGVPPIGGMIRKGIRTVEPSIVK